MNEILSSTELKPYQKTSYFILMIAVVIGGAGLILATSMYLPNVAFLTDAQRGQILETMFQGWGAISTVVVGGNVAARGGLTLLKQWLQNELTKNAAGIGTTPDTVNVATTGDVQTGASSTPATPAEITPEPSPDFPPSIAKPVPYEPSPEPKVEPLPPLDAGFVIQATDADVNHDGPQDVPNPVAAVTP